MTTNRRAGSSVIPEDRRRERLVAAVILALNSTETIESALVSVLTRSYPCNEIVVVDDGSTDGVGDLVRTRFPMVTVLTQSNQGTAAARNRELEIASADSHGHAWSLLAKTNALFAFSQQGVQ